LTSPDEATWDFGGPADRDQVGLSNIASSDRIFSQAAATGKITGAALPEASAFPARQTDRPMRRIGLPREAMTD